MAILRKGTEYTTGRMNYCTKMCIHLPLDNTSGSFWCERRISYFPFIVGRIEMLPGS